MNTDFWNGFWADLGGIPKTSSAMKEVATVAIIKNGKMLMGKRRDNNRFTNPGGHLENNEDPRAGAVREVKEEAGIDLDPSSLIHVKSETVTKKGGTKLKVHAFKTHVSGEVPTSMQNDPDLEVYRWRWIPVDGVPKDIMGNLHVPLEHNILLKNLDVKEAGAEKKAEFREDVQKPRRSDAIHKHLKKSFSDMDRKTPLSAAANFHRGLKKRLGQLGEGGYIPPKEKRGVMEKVAELVPDYSTKLVKELKERLEQDKWRSGLADKVRKERGYEGTDQEVISKMTSENNRRMLGRSEESEKTANPKRQVRDFYVNEDKRSYRAFAERMGIS